MSDYVIPEQRIDLLAKARDAYLAMAQFDRSIDLDPELRELIKIRAAQTSRVGTTPRSSPPASALRSR